MLCRPELEAKDGTGAEGVTELLQGLGVGRVLAGTFDVARPSVMLFASVAWRPTVQGGR